MIKIINAFVDWSNILHVQCEEKGIYQQWKVALYHPFPSKEQLRDEKIEQEYWDNIKADYEAEANEEDFQDDND